MALEVLCAALHAGGVLHQAVDVVPANHNTTARHSTAWAHSCHSAAVLSGHAHKHAGGCASCAVMCMLAGGRHRTTRSLLHALRHTTKTHTGGLPVSRLLPPVLYHMCQHTYFSHYVCNPSKLLTHPYATVQSTVQESKTHLQSFSCSVYVWWPCAALYRRMSSNEREVRPMYMQAGGSCCSWRSRISPATPLQHGNSHRGVGLGVEGLGVGFKASGVGGRPTGSGRGGSG